MKISKFKRIIICLYMTACLMTSLAGCTTYDSFRHAFIDKAVTDSTPVITIGVFEPQTGKDSERGKEEIRGIELANSIYNTVDGYKIVISKVDTQSRAGTAGKAVQGLIEMQPVAIIGSTGEAASLVASEYIQEAGIPCITPSATNPLITQTNDYYFRACTTESQMGEGMAEYAFKEVEARSIGIISIKNDTNSAALIDGFEGRLKKMAGRKRRIITSRSEINDNDEEMKKALIDIKLKGCKVCLVTMGTESMDKLFMMAEDMGLHDVIFLGTRNWGSKEFVSMTARHPNFKVVFPYSSVNTGEDGSSGNNITEEARRFQIEYQNRYGYDSVPTDNAALGYDSYLIIINAIHNAKSLDGRAIRNAMLDTKDLKGVTGVFSFDNNGNVVRSINLSTITNGQVVSEYVTKIEAEAKDLEDVESTQNAEDN